MKTKTRVRVGAHGSGGGAGLRVQSRIKVGSLIGNHNETVAGLRVNATPVALSSPMLPKTIV